MLKETAVPDFFDLFPQDRLGQALVSFALEVNEFAKSPPSLSLEARDRVNGIFEPLLDHEINRNVVRMADEAVASHLQAAGSAVYAIGQVLLRGEHGPLVPATLARTVLENSAVVVFLCEVDDHIRRTGRAINTFHLGLLGTGAGSPSHPLHPIFRALEELKERIGSVGVRKSDKLTSHYNQLVETHLKGIEAGALYKVLNSFTHHNMVSQVGVMTSADHQTPHNYVDIYDFSSRAGAALIYAIDAATPFKHEAKPDLVIARQEVLQRYGEFVMYCIEKQSSSQEKPT